MAGVVSRESYFETGLDVLSDLGYSGLKLAGVCNRLGVTTGSFYHYFANWPAYTKELVGHWLKARTMRVVAAARGEPDPRRRLETLIHEASVLPHGAEAAIRVWSSIDPDVHAVQVAVDRQRFDTMFEAAFEILQNRRQAEVFAAWAVYLMVGYEQTALPRDGAALEWMAEQLRYVLESGNFATIPDDS